MRNAGQRGSPNVQGRNGSGKSPADHPREHVSYWGRKARLNETIHD